jgi:hypothetical protein
MLGVNTPAKVPRLPRFVSDTSFLWAFFRIEIHSGFLSSFRIKKNQ